jgi:glycerol uptake facilitator-like aquaporin
VTVALTALRQIKLPDAAIYIVAQLAGAVAGALLTKAILLDEGDAENYGAPALSEIVDGAAFPGMVVEALGTFFLLWAIIGVAVHPHAAKDWAAFAIGGALGMGVMVLAPITGAGFNAARSFGAMLVSGEWADFFVAYLIGPLVGALVAAVVYFLRLRAARQEGRRGHDAGRLVTRPSRAVARSSPAAGGGASH